MIRLLFAAYCAVTPFLLYLIPAGGMVFTISSVLSYTLLGLCALRMDRRVMSEPAVLLLLGLFGLQAISIVWAPDKYDGFRYLFGFGHIFGALLAGVYIAKNDEPFLYKCLRVFLIGATINSALTIAFRVSPDLEARYLSNPVAKIFSNPSVIEGLLTGEQSNNVLDDEKSGGFYVNGNSSSLLCGVSAILGVFLARRLRSPLSLFCAIVCWLGVGFSGSKSGTIFALIIPFIGFSMRFRSRILVGSLIGVALSIALYIGLYQNFSTGDRDDGIIGEFLRKVNETSASRTAIWSYAPEAFAESPILGQGFGGWFNGFRRFASQHPEAAPFSEFPPHNTFVYIWSQSGVLAAFIAVLFSFRTLSLGWQAALSPYTQEAAESGRLLFMISAWILLAGLGENSGISGDWRQMPVFAWAIVMVLLETRGLRKEQE